MQRQTKECKNTKPDPPKTRLSSFSFVVTVASSERERERRALSFLSHARSSREKLSNNTEKRKPLFLWLFWLLATALALPLRVFFFLRDSLFLPHLFSLSLSPVLLNRLFTS